MSQEEEEEYPYGEYSSEDNQSEHDDDDDDMLPEDFSVQQQIELVQSIFDSGDLNKSETLLEKIKPEDQQTKYSCLILHALISLKRKQLDQSIDFAKQASKEQKNELLPYKIQIYSLMNRKVELLRPILDSMFANTKPDLETMILISNKLHKIVKQNSSFSNTFFDAIREDSSLLPSIEYIMPTKDTLDDRIQILTEYSDKKNVYACSLLIKILIKEKNAIDKAKSYLRYLDENHPTRLLFKVLFGGNPVESAIELCSQKDNDQHFRDFIKFYNEKNLIALQRFVQNEPFFASGWILLSKLMNDNVSKCIALKKADQIYPQKDLKKQIEELDVTMVVQDDKGEDVLINSSPKDRKDFNEAKKIWEKYEKTKDKEVLKPILEVENNFLIAKIKIQAILELADELGEEEKMKQLESIKSTQYRKIYNVLGHMYLKSGNIEEAVKNFIEDANMGSDDPVCLEIASKKLIQEEQIEQALKLCLKVQGYEWAIFRAGLIYQRLRNHRKAVDMFYKIIRNRQNLENNSSFDDDDIQNRILIDKSISIKTVWKVIAQSYASLNRYMALKDVLSELRKMGSPDLDYESLYNVFHEINFCSKVNYDINTSPLQFNNFLSQILSDLKMLKWQGRNDACIEIINRYKNIVIQFMEKYNNLGAILKSSGDFFLEGFILSQNQDNEMLGYSLKAYKRRAEIDQVPESLVDLSNLFHVIGKDDQALVVLKKSLTKYPDSQLVWLNLGVLYALNEKFPLARHCFIVSSQISYDSQNGKVFSYFAAVENVLNYFNMMEKAILTAGEMNMMDVSLLQIKSMNGIIPQFDASLCIYEGEYVSPDLPRLCIKNGKFVEALGFALMLNNNEEISLAYEALGKYDLALQFADDEEQKNRLLKLVDNSSSENSLSSEALDLTINKFKEGNDLISKFTTAALYISKNDKVEACKILRSMLESSRVHKKHHDKEIDKSKATENNNENINENNKDNNNGNENDNDNKNDNDNNNDNENDNNNGNKNDNNNDNENDKDNNNDNENNKDNNNGNENDNNNDNENNKDNNNGNENDNDNKNDNDNENDKDINNSNENDNVSKKEEDDNANNQPLRIPKRYLKLLLSWLLQYEPKSENEITHPMIENDPLLYFLSLKRTESERESAVKMYHKFMNTSPFALKLFILIALRKDPKEINLAKIEAAGDNLFRLSPSRVSYKLLIVAKIKAGKYKDALAEIQKLMILEPDSINLDLIRKLQELIKSKPK